jgi:hypothetical protein
VLALALVWLALAWRGTGRPHHLGWLTEPLLAALVGLTRLPTPQTLHRSLAYFTAHALRAAVEAAYLAELPHRTGRIWAALDAHQLPYWGRGKRDRLRSVCRSTRRRRAPRSFASRWRSAPPMSTG